MPFADVLYAGDHKWWAAYEKPNPEIDWPGWGWFEGLKFTINETAPRQYPCLNKLKIDSKVPLSTNPEYLASGNNSGFQAVNLAFHFGAEEIYLLGFDCKQNGKQNHFHPDHDQTTRLRLTNPNRYLYKTWAKKYPAMVAAMADRGVKLVNCSRDTDLPVPRMALEDVL